MTDPADTFHIAFDTNTLPGKVIVTTVKVTQEIMPLEGVFDARQFRIDLCDHPLYPRLAGYVKGNPGSTRG